MSMYPFENVRVVEIGGVRRTNAQVAGHGIYQTQGTRRIMSDSCECGYTLKGATIGARSEDHRRHKADVVEGRWVTTP